LEDRSVTGIEMVRSEGSRTSMQSRRGRTFVLALVCLAGLVGQTGCYRTTELASGPPAPGTRIVATLTPAGTESMEGMIGADAVGIEARVAEARPEGWELSLLRVDHHRAPSVRWSGEQVVFPPTVLRAVQERRLDALRTGMASVGVGSVLFILARQFMGSWIGGDNGGGGTDPVN
jgi:hypothetical protein